MRTDVIILSAGRSTRMGHPKALTRLGGETAIDRMVRCCAAAGLDAPIVVVGEQGGEIRRALPHLEARARFVENPDPAAGRTGSVQRGLIASVAPRVLVWPVDHPLVVPATLRALAHAPGEWVVPEHAGRGGHPLKLEGMGMTAVESAPPHVPLREIPGMVGLQVARLPVEDDGILANLDTPGDVERARSRKGI